ncbi:MAG: hypothetical protein AAB596_00815 [Patescibacteria group bacterium]
MKITKEREIKISWRKDEDGRETPVRLNDKEVAALRPEPISTEPPIQKDINTSTDAKSSNEENLRYPVMEALTSNYFDICAEKEKENLRLNKIRKRVEMLSVLANEGRITAPQKKRFLSKKRECPNCGKELHREIFEDGGYPDYGDKYDYCACSCGYEYGIIPSQFKDIFKDVLIMTFLIGSALGFIILESSW